jgi:hypothetical protein
MNEEIEQPTYRFKWENLDLDSYVDGLRAKACMLRDEAKILMARAEQIDDFIMDLRHDLLPVETD